MKNYLLLSITVVLLLTTFSCRFLKKKTEISGLPYTTIHQEVKKVDSLYYKIEIQYPVFESKDTSALNLGELNTAISSFLDKAMVYFWSTDTLGAKKMIQETGASGYFILMNKYQVMDSTTSRISVMFETYSYALGAHGFTAITTFNYDLVNGKMLGLSDLIDFSDPGKQKELESFLDKHLENPDSCFYMKPTIDPDFKRFAVAPDHLLFYYEAYELGPYSCGTATIKIPIEELKASGLFIIE